MAANASTRSATPDGDKPRRGRPTAARVERIDASIVETARAIFLAEGFDAVGMKQVAEQARVSKGTLYARYPSKEALFCAVVEQSVEQWSEEAARFDALLTDDIEQRLRHHARTIATWLNRPDVIALQRLVFTVAERFPELAGTMRRKGYDYIVNLIAGDIAAAAQRDGRSVRDPLAVARMLVGSLSGVRSAEGANLAREEDVHAFAARVVDVIIGGRSAW